LRVYIPVVAVLVSTDPLCLQGVGDETSIPSGLLGETLWAGLAGNKKNGLKFNDVALCIGHGVKKHI